MQKKFLLLIVLIISILNFGYAQSPNWQWAKSIGGNGLESGTDVIADNNGNVFTIGYFNDTVDFNPGAGVFNMIANPLNGSVFLTKYNSSGNFMWAKQWDKDIYSQPFTLNTDATGNIYITGHYTGNFDADPGAGTFYLPTVGDIRYFILKLGSSGNFIWAKTFGGVYNTPLCYTELDNSGNIYLAGFFSFTYDFDPGPAIYNMTATSRDIFILKLDQSGNFLWAKQTTGSLNTWVNDVALDGSGNIFITGSFSGTTDFDPGAGVANLTAGTTVSDEDIYILKLNNTGNFSWVHQFGTNYLNRPGGIKIDQSGNVYSCGRYSGTVDFDPGPAVFNLNNSGCYISKLDNAGNFIFAKSINSPGGFVYGESLALDDAANMYVTGGYNDTIDFDPGPGTYNLTSDSIGFASYMAAYNSNGNFTWAESKGGHFHFGLQQNMGTSVFVDNGNNIYFTGRYEDPEISFGSNTILNNNPDTLDLTDAFVTKIGSLTTSLNEDGDSPNSALSIYPNPSKGIFNFSSSEIFTEITCYNVLGEIVFHYKNINTYNYVMDLSTCQKGIYFYELKNDDMVFKTGKILLN